MTFHLSRLALLRSLGAVYLVAFLSLVAQVSPLLGSTGLTPAADFLRDVAAAGEDGNFPGVFSLGVSDSTLVTCAWAGVALSTLVALGVANAPILAGLWLIYLSFVHVGQQWLSYGWEILLLEAGFLAIWLAPPWRLRGTDPPPIAVLWLYRWLLFRLMLGAGLIKLRGDPCWRDLTCLDTHFETQPLPNPLSPWFHALPAPVHAGMVVATHVVELILPWFCLGPRPARTLAAVGIGAFQVTLLASGNLAFLNWLTLALCLSLLDDGHLRRSALPTPVPTEAGPFRRGMIIGVTLLVATLSVEPVLNLLSPRQAMNRSYGSLHLVNSYGMFGSVGKDRDEVILQGTVDGRTWVDYEFPCKPGALDRRPCFVAPFQPRLDWQIWFAAMQDPRQHVWLLHLAWKLLHGAPEATALLAGNPFPDTAPIAIRAELYRYRFATKDEPGWWARERTRSYFRPFTANDEALNALADEREWR